MKQTKPTEMTDGLVIVQELHSVELSLGYTLRHPKGFPQGPRTICSILKIRSQR